MCYLRLHSATSQLQCAPKLLLWYTQKASKTVFKWLRFLTCKISEKITAIPWSFANVSAKPSTNRFLKHLITWYFYPVWLESSWKLQEWTLLVSTKRDKSSLIYRLITHMPLCCLWVSVYFSVFCSVFGKAPLKIKHKSRLISDWMWLEYLYFCLDSLLWLATWHYPRNSRSWNSFKKTIWR